MKNLKSVSNSDLAELLRSVAAALELSPGDNNFRIIAYQRAADSIDHASSQIHDLWQAGKLNTLSGVGETLESYLDELFRTGRVSHFVKILRGFPPALYVLLKVPGIGPKSAYKLCKALGLSRAHTAISKLTKAARHGQVARIAGFGEGTQTAILRGISEFQRRSRRLLLNQAEAIADSLREWLRKLPNIQNLEVLGSYRRRVSTVGDLDIAVSSDNPEQVLNHFTAYPQKSRILQIGDTKASLVLPDDHQVDLMVQSPASFGSLLQHFTGSKHHNIALREYAQKKGLSLSEYGIKILNNKLFPSPSHRHDQREKLGEGLGVRYNKSLKLYQFSSETAFYNFLGLDYIPPELREDNGEIQAAKSHQLPHLISLADIRGDLHVHSNLDLQPSHDLGQSSLMEIADRAAGLGYQYIGLSEHNPAVSAHSQHQIMELIKTKSYQITEFNQASEKHHEKNLPYLFNALEIDILADGNLAVPDTCLDLLDYAVVAIHSSFSQSKKVVTQRVIQGLSHPKVRFLAHPSSRLLNQREEIDLDWDKLFDFCLKNHKWLEINSWPNRLDLPDYLVRQAVTLKVPMIINTDSHHVDQMSYIHYGVSVARRGWASKSDIVNTQDLTQMRKLLKGGD